MVKCHPDYSFHITKLSQVYPIPLVLIMKQLEVLLIILLPQLLMVFIFGIKNPVKIFHVTHCHVYILIIINSLLIQTKFQLINSRVLQIRTGQPVVEHEMLSQVVS
jgi:hypothetical protein